MVPLTKKMGLVLELFRSKWAWVTFNSLFEKILDRELDRENKEMDIMVDS